MVWHVPAQMIAPASGMKNPLRLWTCRVVLQGARFLPIDKRRQ